MSDNKLFQSSAGPKPGRYNWMRPVSTASSKFQSSAGPKPGRYSTLH